MFSLNQLHKSLTSKNLIFGRCCMAMVGILCRMPSERRWSVRLCMPDCVASPSQMCTFWLFDMSSMIQQFPSVACCQREVICTIFNDTLVLNRSCSNLLFVQLSNSIDILSFVKLSSIKSRQPKCYTWINRTQLQYFFFKV